MDLLSRLDLQEIGRRYMLARATKIDPAQVDTQGSDANLFVGSTSFMGSAITQQIASRVNALFLDGAEKEDLDRYAFDRYQLPRKGAAPARGSAKLFRPTAALGAGSLALGTKVKSLTGIEYVTTEVAQFGVLTLAVVVKVKAVQAGKDFQVGRNQLRRVVGAFDPSIQAINEDPTAGGEPVEDDIDFRERIRDYWATARRGTLGAISFGARAVAGVTSAQASEALNGGGQPARVVNMAIADSSGVANAALAAEVQTRLLEYRAAGIQVILTTSIPQIVDVVLQLSFAAGVDTSTIGEAIRAAVFEFVNGLPVSGTLYRQELGALLQRFRPQGLLSGQETIVEPAGDLVPAPGATLRTTLANITIL